MQLYGGEAWCVSDLGISISTFPANYTVMSLQSRLAQAQSRLLKKLYDNNVSRVGTETHVVHLQRIEDRYRDEELTVVSRGVIIGYFDYPNDIPLFQDRESSLSNNVSESGFSVYDLLPIRASFRNVDNVSEGDIIVRKFGGYEVAGKPFIQAYRVTEMLGAFNSHDLLRIKYDLAPYSMSLDQYPEIEQALLDIEVS